MNPLLLLAVIAQLGGGATDGPQPPSNTTDVDESTTPTEASPLAPTDPAATAPDQPAPGSRSLDDIFSAIPPYEPPAPQVKAPEERPRPGFVLATPAPALDAPISLYDPNTRPDGPPSDSDTLYETRVLGAFRAAQIRQGPLDGRWLVRRPNGDTLYALQFADSGDVVEGAWRDMKAKGALGLIDSIERQDADTIVRFQEQTGGKAMEVRVHPQANGAWSGQALTASGRVPVEMVRDQGVEVAAMDAPIYVPPPPPPPKAKVSKKRGKSKATTSKRKSSSKAKAPSKPRASASKSKKKR